ncbi:peptide-N4-(N-acetyl-beta-glucosaminyl)asparagine amidase A [Selaginella moellendorffii]|nr:peptide-N4-(N-acetyl-beta-glucosaminyl)asparagine amidase A [Selaginella moellendorffii]|eukprot:XP_002982418.2 peptide-N4-(N-acetyl-beta-glucosaminyl)asparagine amidase A [Selaginella moellendorffii]
MALVLFLLFLAATAQGKGRFRLGGLDFEHSEHRHSSLAPAPAPAPDPAPLTFFEVSKPLSIPRSGHCATLLLLKHSFGNTISSPPVTAPYNPPRSSHCGGGWERVILRWSVASRGRQFDRISAAWLSGVEIFRTCTAEPTKQGIVWSVEKDITKYTSLLEKPQVLAVSLANVIDKTYTGFFNVTLTAEFYKPAQRNSKRSSKAMPADLVLPIALPTSENGGYWFQLQNSSHVGTVNLTSLPRNIYKAELEVCVSFHGDDEFWYTNPTNDYLDANGESSSGSRNGPYREVLVTLDGKLVGEICPFPVIYTGGVNPLFWRPAAAIGAFNLPTYILDVTPFVGQLVDGNSHEISLSVTNAVRNWLLDANLHLWLDHGSSQTSGKLISYSSPPAVISYDSHYKGLDGTLLLSASRSLQYSGYVESSSHGKLITTSSYSYKFSNQMVFSENGSVSTVKQLIDAQTKFLVESSSKQVRLQQKSSSYPFFLYNSQKDGTNKSVVLDARISHGLQEEYDDDSFWSRLNNKQDTAGKIVIQANIVTSGTGKLNQTYVSESSEGCYHRSIRTSNTTTQYDESGFRCIASA